MKKLTLLFAITLFGHSCSVAAESSPDVSDAAGEILLVGNKGEDTLSFIDLHNGKEIARRETGPNPHEVAISPDGQLAAVVSYGAEHIDIFDIAARERIEVIALTPNKRPHGVAWLEDGRIVATTEGSDSITIVHPPSGEDQARKIEQIETGQQGTHMLALTPDQSRLFTANMQSGSVSLLDLASGRKIADFPAGKQPEGIAITPDGKTVWVADRQSDQLLVFDAEKLERLSTLQTGKFPIRVAISPDGKTAITSNYADGSLSLFDVVARKTKGTIILGGNADTGQVTILFSADGSRLYVAETGTNQIAEVDMSEGKLRRRFDVGTNGDGLGIVTRKIFEQSE